MGLIPRRLRRGGSLCKITEIMEDNLFMNYINNTKCFLCGGMDFMLLHEGVRGSKEINAVKCRQCGLVQLDKFIADLDSFYKESNMRPEQKSIRQIRSETYTDDYRRFQFTREMIENRTVLDFGSGGGGTSL